MYWWQRINLCGFEGSIRNNCLRPPMDLRYRHWPGLRGEKFVRWLRVRSALVFMAGINA